MKEQNFVPREFDIFGGLDVDKKSIAVTFMNHEGVVQSARASTTSRCRKRSATHMASPAERRWSRCS